MINQLFAALTGADSGDEFSPSVVRMGAYEIVHQSSTKKTNSGESVKVILPDNTN